jgi:ribose transport system substrate-binding protein
MKKIALCFFICFLIIPLITGCSNKPTDNVRAKSVGSPPGDSKTRVKRIALVMKTLTNPFFVEMERGARKAEKEFNIELVVKTGAQETSIEQQIVIVEELIREKIDAIVIAPASSNELVPVLKKARDAGIPVVNIDNRLDPKLSEKAGLVDIPFISVDNVRGAFLSAKYVCDQITKPTKAAVIEGIRAANNAQQRKEGALKAFRENRNIEVAAIETANWKIDEAYEVTKRIFTKHRDIGVLFCANDMMALGALHYLEESGNKGVLVAAFDALDEAKEAIRKGRLAATIDQQADQQGYLGIRYALDLLEGKKPLAETIVEVKVVSKK